MSTAVNKDENVAAPVSAAAAAPAEQNQNSDDAKSNQSEVKELVASLKSLSQKRRVFRQVQLNYSRIKKSFAKFLVPPTSEEVADKVAESDKKEPEKSPEKVEKEKVNATHRLLRNFNYAVNVQTMGRDEDKRVFPERFATEIETIFVQDKEALVKIKKALQVQTKEDQVKELPESLTEKTLKGVAEFLEKHEKVEILDKLEAQLNEMTKEIDEKKSKLKTLRPQSDKAKSPQSSGQSRKNKNSAKKSPKTSSPHSDDDLPAEERFRLLIQEVNDRVSKIKIQKDDYALYVKMQEEIDGFLHEAMTEIKAIKKRFQDRFEKVQSGAGNGNERRRRVRSRSNNARRSRRDQQ